MFHKYYVVVRTLNLHEFEAVCPYSYDNHPWTYLVYLDGNPYFEKGPGPWRNLSYSSGAASVTVISKSCSCISTTRRCGARLTPSRKTSGLE
jgi:hypothetical protein